MNLKCGFALPLGEGEGEGLASMTTNLLFPFYHYVSRPHPGPLPKGEEATKQITNHDRKHTIPVVAVTAHQESDFREEAKASGFDAYVTKPIDFDWLSELMVGLIG